MWIRQEKEKNVCGNSTDPTAWKNWCLRTRGQELLKRCLWVDLDLLPNFSCIFSLIVYHCLLCWSLRFLWLYILILLLDVLFLLSLFFMSKSPFFSECSCFMDTISFLLSLKFLMLILFEVFFCSLHYFYSLFLLSVSICDMFLGVFLFGIADCSFLREKH